MSTQLNRLNRYAASGLILQSLCWMNGAALSQTSRSLPAEVTNVQILETHPNADDENDMIVSVRVTIKALDRSIVIPNCAEEESQVFFGVAQLTRRNRKMVPVRKHLAATMGFLTQDYWKPVSLSPESQKTFAFAYSTRLLDVSPGEELRVKIQIWPNAESMNSWKSAITIFTPVFKNPSKTR